MAVAIGPHTTGDLCKALGLEGRMVKRIRIDVPHDGIVTADVEMLVEDGEGDGLVDVLRHYELHESTGPFKT